eukprot:CAMPEP_0184560078 /NCGR_PEP_ID=MMETSP0199_2-20130426/46752_1 /TAXON_ID=1112570 /ORGANISM="Thraustochytrium sp., Strain LLF1b" /LENGTH=1422 /DNA_ID=CAMNT_0026957377 /DNA_START=291 /DNA_END=4559 /DNA_ORIENTATION=+
MDGKNEFPDEARPTEEEKQSPWASSEVEDGDGASISTDHGVGSQDPVLAGREQSVEDISEISVSESVLTSQDSPPSAQAPDQRKGDENSAPQTGNQDIICSITVEEESTSTPSLLNHEKSDANSGQLAGGQNERSAIAAEKEEIPSPPILPDHEKGDEVITSLIGGEDDVSAEGESPSTPILSDHEKEDGGEKETNTATKDDGSAIIAEGESPSTPILSDHEKEDGGEKETNTATNGEDEVGEETTGTHDTEKGISVTPQTEELNEPSAPQSPPGEVSEQEEQTRSVSLSEEIPATPPNSLDGAYLETQPGEDAHAECVESIGRPKEEEEELDQSELQTTSAEHHSNSGDENHEMLDAIDAPPLESNVRGKGSDQLHSGYDELRDVTSGPQATGEEHDNAHGAEVPLNGSSSETEEAISSTLVNLDDLLPELPTEQVLSMDLNVGDVDVIDESELVEKHMSASEEPDIPPIPPPIANIDRSDRLSTPIPVRSPTVSIDSNDDSDVGEGNSDQESRGSDTIDVGGGKGSQESGASSHVDIEHSDRHSHRSGSTDDAFEPSKAPRNPRRVRQSEAPPAYQTVSKQSIDQSLLDDLDDLDDLDEETASSVKTFDHAAGDKDPSQESDDEALTGEAQRRAIAAIQEAEKEFLFDEFDQELDDDEPVDEAGLIMQAQAILTVAQEEMQNVSEERERLGLDRELREGEGLVDPSVNHSENSESKSDSSERGLNQATADACAADRAALEATKIALEAERRSEELERVALEAERKAALAEERANKANVKARSAEEAAQNAEAKALASEQLAIEAEQELLALDESNDAADTQNARSSVESHNTAQGDSDDSGHEVANQTNGAHSGGEGSDGGDPEPVDLEKPKDPLREFLMWLELIRDRFTGKASLSKEGIVPSTIVRAKSPLQDHTTLEEGLSEHNAVANPSFREGISSEARLSEMRRQAEDLVVATDERTLILRERGNQVAEKVGAVLVALRHVQAPTGLDAGPETEIAIQIAHAIHQCGNWDPLFSVMQIDKPSSQRGKRDPSEAADDNFASVLMRQAKSRGEINGELIRQYLNVVLRGLPSSPALNNLVSKIPPQDAARSFTTTPEHAYNLGRVCTVFRHSFLRLSESLYTGQDVTTETLAEASNDLCKFMTTLTRCIIWKYPTLMGCTVRNVSGDPINGRVQDSRRGSDIPRASTDVLLVVRTCIEDAIIDPLLDNLYLAYGAVYGEQDVELATKCAKFAGFSNRELLNLCGVSTFFQLEEAHPWARGSRSGGDGIHNIPYAAAIEMLEQVWLFSRTPAGKISLLAQAHQKCVDAIFRHYSKPTQQHNSSGAMIVVPPVADRQQLIPRKKDMISIFCFCVIKSMPPNLESQTRIIYDLASRHAISSSDVALHAVALLCMVSNSISSININNEGAEEGEGLPDSAEI